MALPGSSAAPAVDRRRDDFAYRVGRRGGAPRRARHPPAPDHDQGGVRERHRGHDGARRFHQRGAPPARDRARGRGRARARRLQPRRAPRPAHRRHEAARQVPHGRPRSRSVASRSSCGSCSSTACSTATASPSPARPWPRTSPISIRRRPTARSSTRSTAPIHTQGGIAVLRGLARARTAAIVKVAGIDELRFDGTARVFDGEELAMEAILAGPINAGDIVVDPVRRPEGRSRDARDARRHRRA